MIAFALSWTNLSFAAVQQTLGVAVLTDAHVKNTEVSVWARGDVMRAGLAPVNEGILFNGANAGILCKLLAAGLLLVCGST